jgi:WD40 repeat protein
LQLQKGSLPLSIIKAHNSKIYGIDWSHNRRNEIVTCSLDKTIKLWDIQGTNPTQPTATICTAYPVWRARDLPFGQGVLSLPQRGSTELEMWANGESVETFVGHSDVVKEFVWRKSGYIVE